MRATIKPRIVITAFAMGAFVILALGSNCETLHPPQGPNTAYPCGLWGVECSLDNTCCPYKHECGGHKGYFTTCPEGYCCYTGDDWPRVGAGPDGGVERPMTPQLPRVSR